MIVPGSANPLLLAAGGSAPVVSPDGCCSLDPYTVKGSVRLRQTAKGILNRTFPAAGNLKKWTFSTWIKRGILNANNTNGPTMFQCVFGGYSGYSDAGFAACYTHSTGGLTLSGYNTTNYKITNQKVEDTTAWYHWVWSIDTDNANAADRVRIFINGTRATFSTDVAISAGQTFGINTAGVHTLGYDNVSAGYWIDAYYAETQFIDGQALDASAFGEFCLTTSQWNPKKYTGAYGTNGFYLDFQDPNQIGKDVSGNNNHWTPHNIDTAAPGTQVTYDVMKDSPSRDAKTGVGNYAVFDSAATSGPVDGNLTHNAIICAPSTIIMNTGKWYYEGVPTANGGNGEIGFTIPSVEGIFLRYNGNVYHRNAAVGNAHSFGDGDVTGVSIDCDAGTVTYYDKTGVATFTYTGISPGNWVAYLDAANSRGGAVTWNVNFGQRPFTNAIPAGYNPLCTAFLGDTAIPAGIRCKRGAIT